MVGGLGRLEHHVRGGGGEDARDRDQARGGGEAPLHPGAVPPRDAHPHRDRGPPRLPLHPGRALRLPPPRARRVRRNARSPRRSSSSPPPRSSARSASWPATSPPAGRRSSTRSWRSSSHEVRGRRARSRLAPLPRRPRPPDEEDRPHRPRHRLGHALDRPPPLLRRGPQAVAVQGVAGDGRERRRRVAGRDHACLDGPPLGPAHPDQGGGPRPPALADPRDRAAVASSTRSTCRSRWARRASTRACVAWSPSSARCGTSTPSPGAAS